MKVRMFFFLIVAVVCCIFTALGCKSVGLEAEEKLGITANEVRARSLKVLTGDGLISNATSFETVYYVAKNSQNLLGRKTIREYVELTRYLEPDCLLVAEIYAKNSIKRLIVNPQGIWEVDIAGAQKKISSNQDRKAFEFAMDMQNPAKSDSDLWRLIELEESDYCSDSCYKLVFYPKLEGTAIKSYVEYVNKTTYLPVRSVMRITGDRSVTTDMLEYCKFNTVQMPSRTRSFDSQTEDESVRILQSFKINCLNKDCCCDFEPDAPIHMTLPGCKFHGPEPKPRTFYEPTQKQK